MAKLISVFRASLLIVLSFIGFILLFGEEQAQDNTIWVLHFLADKSIAVAAFYGTYKLYNHWKDTDPLIKAYDKWAEMSEEKFK